MGDGGQGAPKVLLVGMMGAGKSAVGRSVASRLGWVHLDSDAEVRRRTGRTIPEIFESDGESAFRAEETAVLREAIEREEPAVVSVAGGALLEPGNRRLVSDAGLVVWLRATLDTLTQRVGDGRTRPLLGSDPGAALERLYPQREPVYREVADVILDVEHASIAQLADRVVAAVEAMR
jgi:shikimate kinase